MFACDVAVIIPTYNRLDFLKKALSSVLDQTFPAREIIVVDDGSSDGTLEWLQQQELSNLKILPQKNRGPAHARNQGVKVSSSRYLAFLDSDDYWFKKKLQTQFEFMIQHPSIKLCQTEEIWMRDGKRVNPMLKHAKPSGWIFENCLPLCLISPSAVMIEREFFEGLEGFDESFEVCEDYELWLRAALRSEIVTLSEALVVKQGGHEDQLSKKHWGMDRFRVTALEKLMNSEVLNDEQRNLVLSELAKKLKILSQGFTKRFPNEKNLYQEKLNQYQFER